MSQDKNGGHQLKSIQQLGVERDRAENERETICSFIRYVQRQADDQHTKSLLRALREDIEDVQHYNEAYQI